MKLFIQSCCAALASGSRLSLFAALLLIGSSLPRSEGAASPALRIEQLDPSRLLLIWPAGGGTFVVEQAANLRTPVPWIKSSQSAVLTGGDYSITVTPT